MTTSLVRARLVNDASVTALVSTRIYYRFLQPDCALPAISFLPAGDAPLNALDGELATKNERWQIDCWSKSVLELESLSDAVIAAMAATGSDFSSVRLPKTYAFEESTGLHRMILEFSIWY